MRPERLDFRPEGPDKGGGRTNERTNERKSPCVLQDFVPFGAAAQKGRMRGRENENENEKEKEKERKREREKEKEKERSKKKSNRQIGASGGSSKAGYDKVREHGSNAPRQRAVL